MLSQFLNDGVLIPLISIITGTGDLFFNIIFLILGIMGIDVPFLGEPIPFLET